MPDIGGGLVYYVVFLFSTTSKDPPVRSRYTAFDLFDCS